MKDGEVEKRKGRKSERKWLIKKVERWKMTSFVSPKIAVMHRSMYVYTHSTSLSADSGYFSLNTAVLSDWAIAMVIRKMWSEQQAFERWSLLHTNTHTTTLFCLSHMLYYNHSALTPTHTLPCSTLSHKRRPHKPTVPSHTNTLTTPRTLSPNTQQIHTQQTFTLTKPPCGHPCTHPDTLILHHRNLPLSPRLMYMHPDFSLTHMHTHRYTPIDKWWCVVCCSRWTLRKLTSGSGRKKHLIKSRKDHTNMLHTKKIRQITLVCPAVHTCMGWAAVLAISDEENRPIKFF